MLTEEQVAKWLELAEAASVVRKDERPNREQQIALLRLALQALSQQGKVWVPVEPTEAMLAAIRQKPHPTRPDGWDDRHRRIYKAMIAAATESSIGTLPVGGHSPDEQNASPPDKQENK